MPHPAQPDCAKPELRFGEGRYASLLPPTKSVLYPTPNTTKSADNVTTETTVEIMMVEVARWT